MKCQYMCCCATAAHWKLSALSVLCYDTNLYIRDLHHKQMRGLTCKCGYQMHCTRDM